MSPFVQSATVVVLLCLQAEQAGASVYEVNADGSVDQTDRALAERPSVSSAERTRLSSTRADTRARAWRPSVDRAAARYAVSPALVDAIAHTESRYNPSARSPAGAVGIMQLMPGAARQMGVDRLDPEANLLGGTAYVRYLLNRFDGDLLCTIAAYNAGPGAVAKHGCSPNYRETRAYVRQVLDRLAKAAGETGTSEQ